MFGMESTIQYYCGLHISGILKEPLLNRCFNKLAHPDIKTLSTKPLLLLLLKVLLSGQDSQLHVATNVNKLLKRLMCES